MDQIDALAGTKQTTGDKSYRTQLPPSVMKSITGFSSFEFYMKRKKTFRVYIRAPLDMPFDSLLLLCIIFPALNRWRQEWASENGDRGASAKLIMEEILPFLAMVILQDGVYWYTNHPTNDASIQLGRMVFDNGHGQRISFPQYAKNTLQKINEERRRERVTEVEEVDEETRRRFGGTGLVESRLNYKLDSILRLMTRRVSSF